MRGKFNDNDVTQQRMKFVMHIIIIHEIIFYSLARLPLYQHLFFSFYLTPTLVRSLALSAFYFRLSKCNPTIFYLKFAERVIFPIIIMCMQQ